MKYVLYNYGGSANHGCEALARTIGSILLPEKSILLSNSPEEDHKFGLDNIISSVDSIGKPSRFFWIKAYLKLKLQHDYQYMDAISYFPSLRIIENDDVAVSIGGDVYCYEQAPMYIAIDQMVRKRAKRMILLGCSIEPSLLGDQIFCENLSQFDLITAREHITYDALVNAGIKKVQYFPDTAFSLTAKETELPGQFQKGNTIGLNISPLVLRKSQNPSLIINNFKTLIDYILAETDSSVALIPHVLWESNDDRIPLNEIYQFYKESDRVCMIEDQSAERLKWIISQCSFFIGARTHATIAAYSTDVPTLAIGYSVKSRGIARDLFGTEEGYVLPYQDINNEDVLLEFYLQLQSHRKEILSTLKIKNVEYMTLLGKLKEVLLRV